MGILKNLLKIVTKKKEPLPSFPKIAKVPTIPSVTKKVITPPPTPAPTPKEEIPQTTPKVVGGGGGGFKPIVPTPSEPFTPIFKPTKIIGVDVGVERQPVTTSPYIVTPQEAVKLRQAGYGGFYPSQATSLGGAVQEGAYVSSGVMVYPETIGRTRSEFEFNLASILGASEIYKIQEKQIKEFEEEPEKFKGRGGVKVTQVEGGEIIELTPEYFKTIIPESTQKEMFSIAKKQARREFKKLPEETQLKLKKGSVTSGIVSGGLAIPEFIGTELRQLSPKDVSKTKKTEKFMITGKVGSIGKAPSDLVSYETFGKGLVFVPLVVGGTAGFLKGVKEGGLKKSILQTTASFSPLHVKGGVYPRINERSVAKIVSYKTKDSGITKRVFTGTKDESVKILGTELYSPKLEYGRGVITTQTPKIKVGAGGVSVEPRMVTDIKTYDFRSIGAGKSILGKDVKTIQKGAVSAVQLYGGKKAGFEKSLVGTAYKQEKGFIDFVGGKALSKTQVFYKVSPTGKIKEVIYTPTGKYSVKPQVVGREFTLTKPSGDIGKVITTSKSTAGYQKLTKELTTGITGAIQQPKTPTLKQSGKVIGIISPKTSKIEQQLIHGKSKTFIQEKVKQDVVKDISPKVYGGTAQEVKQIQRNVLPPIILTEQFSKLNQREKEITAMGTGTRLKQQLREQQKLKAVTGLGLTGISTFTPTTFKKGFFIPPLIPPIGTLPTGAISGYRGKRKKTDRLFRYSPSLKPLVFREKPIKVSRKQFERLSKMKFTGLEVRPKVIIK